APYNNMFILLALNFSVQLSVAHPQTQNGGKWNHIGVFTLSAGDENLIGVSRWTSAAGYVLADL
ncbi:hypothetical protein ABNF65_24450, partial [Paenibacillus larvae]